MEGVVREKKKDIAQADTFTQLLKLPRERKEQAVTKEVRKRDRGVRRDKAGVRNEEGGKSE